MWFIELKEEYDKTLDTIKIQKRHSLGKQQAGYQRIDNGKKMDEGRLLTEHKGN